MTDRLSEAMLDRLPPEVERFGYDRSEVRTGIVHLGIGAFHRAHQAVTFDDLLRLGDMRWGIAGASLRSPAARDAMTPQDDLYSLLVRDAEGERLRLIGAVKDVLVAPENPRALIEAMAAPDILLVTLTVTEKGYLPDPADSIDMPRTAAAFIAAALALRRERGLAPFTAISCDNLPHNGSRLRESVLAIAPPALRSWIEDEAAFPQTMVDRIVPATDEADIAALAARVGVEDRAMVKTEPFLQWVIEDRFAGSRPDFATPGVQVTADVAPWEEAKLRLLNGAHSGIAYLGGLAGIEFVHQFVAEPWGRAFVESLWDEAQTTLSPPPGLDIAAYREALMERFSNPALQHRTRQIAMDGSQKLPQRLLAPIAARLEQGRPIDRLALAVAAWMRWQTGRDDAGNVFTVDDPLAAETARRIAGLADPADQAKALLGIQAIFPPKLAADSRFVEAVTGHARLLAERGARGVLAS